MDKIFDPSKIEHNHYQAWEESGVFSCDPQSKAAAYSIMMPPPNVTGSLHMGHALNTTLQDLLTRYYRMKGRDALWQPGTDHAGIATQMVVERMLADEASPGRRELGREKFLERVWKWKEQSGGTIVGQMRALGATPDWSRERFTMDEGLSRAVVKVFVQLYKENLIYKDKRLVNWDTKLLTAISDLEVEERETKGNMWYLRYPIEGEQAEYITVATTRPETMLGDTAVAVHPDDERYQHLIGKFVSLPLTERLIPIIADSYCDPDKGTGAVKITPAHDFNDFEVGKRHNLPMINIFDIHGNLNENAPEAYIGLDRSKARKKVLAELEDLELLDRVENITHVVPYGDRSGVVIEPYLTDQWYVDAATLAKPAVEAVESGKTVFVPKNWENTYFEWMRNIQPWCISRQLWWGHQIPAWYGPDGYVFVEETEDEAIKAAVLHYGQTVTLVRDEDVLDTWFSSALWPFSTLGWPDNTPALEKYYPTDVLLTGFDIIFFWVARMMMMGLHFMKDVPFRTVYIHALVRDAKGQKMSKSKGNVLDPLELTQKYGADALRFTLISMAAQGRDIRLSEERLEGYRNFATKLWNATRYCEMNNCLAYTSDFKPSNVQFLPNQWILEELVKTQKAIDKAIEDYRFNDAASAIYHFVWGTFCDWYIEFTKPLLQTEGEHTSEIRNTTAWVLEQILVLLNPFMPYITEELYSQIGTRKDGDRLISHSWPTYQLNANNNASLEMNWLQRVINEIRSVRSDMNVPAGAKIPLMVKDAGETSVARFDTYSEIILRMARIETISFTHLVPSGSVQAVIDDSTLILPVTAYIDVAKELDRLVKQVSKLTQEDERISGQLANGRFIENAPSEIIEGLNARKQELNQLITKYKQAIDQLK